MITRTIVGVVAIPLILLVLLIAPEIVTAVVVAAMASIAAYELLNNTKLVRHPRLLIYTMLMAFVTPLWCYFGGSRGFALVCLLLFYILLFGEMMLSKNKLPFSRVALCMMVGVVLPYLLAALIRILMMDKGRYYIMIPIIVAFLSDSGAYFAGVFLGKHKLCPSISPNKTVEGLVGGLAASILGMVIYGLVLQLGFDFKVNYFFVIIYGLVGALGGVFGDLSFSVIKRQTGIKDYGNLIPGHGGILDRFDSMIVVAPLVEALLLILPIVA